MATPVRNLYPFSGGVTKIRTPDRKSAGPGRRVGLGIPAEPLFRSPTDESGSLNKSLKFGADGDSCQKLVSVFGRGDKDSDTRSEERRAGKEGRSRHSG